MTGANEESAAEPYTAVGGPTDPGRVVLINLTPHPVNVFDADRVVGSWPPAGPFARRAEIWSPAGSLITDQGSLPLTDVSYGSDVLELPEPVTGTAYVVSRVLADAVPREDLYFPADEVRDHAGQIIGCRTLARFHRPTKEPADA